MTKTAVLLGATGLVGSQLLGQLLEDSDYSRVIVLGRRPVGRSHPKLVEHIVDFGAPESWAALVAGDVLFSALGTTRKVSGSQAAQYRVDHTYPLDAAKAAARSGVPTYVLISSYGANPKARTFYLRMKGDLERDVATLGFARTRFLRPGPLDGPRQEHRSGEALFLRVLRPLSMILPDAVKPIQASQVARAARRAAADAVNGVQVLEPTQLFSA